jgi:hypothetical protein
VLRRLRKGARLGRRTIGPPHRRTRAGCTPVSGATGVGAVYGGGTFPLTDGSALQVGQVCSSDAGALSPYTSTNSVPQPAFSRLFTCGVEVCDGRAAVPRPGKSGRGRSEVVHAVMTVRRRACRDLPRCALVSITLGSCQAGVRPGPTHHLVN